MGGDKAPESIRKNSLFYSVHHNRGYFPEIDDDLVLLDNLRIVDYGDVKVVPEDIQETLNRISKKVSDIVMAGAVPIVLGGDHTIPYPVLRAVLEPRKKKIGLIAFDSHLDLSYEPAYWASSQWLRTLEIGKISPKNFIQIGIRGARNSLYEKKVAEALGHRIFTIDDVKEKGIQRVMHESIALASKDTQGIYVSLDIDVMEPGLVPAQKAPEFWGLTTDEMIPALRMVSKENIVGFDICELTPDYDINGMGAQFAARCAVEILCGLALLKRG
jgi:arginase family enzyme